MDYQTRFQGDAEIQSQIVLSDSLQDIERDQKYSGHMVLRRDGEVTEFAMEKIAVAIDKAFIATKANQVGQQSQSIRELVLRLATEVSDAVTSRVSAGSPIHIEDIQDQVELALMRSEEREVARNFVLYRERRAAERRQKQKPAKQKEQLGFMVLHPDGTSKPLEVEQLTNLIDEACANLEHVDGELIFQETTVNLYPNVPLNELNTILTMATRPLVEKEPNYSYVCARFLLDTLRTSALKEVMGQDIRVDAQQMKEMYPDYFTAYISKGIEYELLDARLQSDFDLSALGQALQADRDANFTFLGLQTLYDRYFLHKNHIRFEMPQTFFMRVAMGLAMHEEQKTQRAIEFYNVLSNFDFMCSTPTLFNSGTLRPQLSSCYLTTVSDDLDNIYESLKDNALIIKICWGFRQ